MTNVSVKFGMDHRINTMQDIPIIVPSVFVPKRINHAINTTLCGVEIEVERTKFDDEFVTDYWGITDDGSLRDGGAELVSRMGMAVGHIPAAMQSLNKYVEKVRKERGKNYFQFSERCSVHIHLDIRNFTNEMVEALLILYTLYEDQLFKLCSPLRMCNVFCIPLRHSTVNLSAFGDPDVWMIINRFTKYCAINLEAAKKYGTVEFRHHEGTFSETDIFEWAYILSLLRYFAERTDIKVLREKVSKLKTESAYETLTREIFHGFSSRILERTNPLTMDLAVSDAKIFFMGEV